ncbi:MAG: hypothetical protein K2J08_11765 [Ruminococcus sp.]|nr:hypothetical protein [Ruminococcus sp.]
MKKFRFYLPSLILSVILVFLIIGSALAVVVKVNVTAEKSISLSDRNGINNIIYQELEKYFSDQSNTTGIPSDVYMSAIDEEYIKNVTDMYTNALFASLKAYRKYFKDNSKEFHNIRVDISDIAVTAEVPENKSLENNITNFFNDYADSINYEKDEAFNKKIQDTIDNSYKIIASHCDAYKYSTLQKHGVLAKISRVYSRIGIIAVAVTSVAVFFMLLLLLINRKNISVCLYWWGISSAVAGLFGTVPSVYLTSTGFFDSFIIKQPQVFKAFTGAMYGLTRAFMAVNIAVLLVGICLVIAYAVFGKVSSEKDN